MAAPKSKTSNKTGADALVANSGVSLTEEELSQVSGGKGLKLEPIDGESADSKHKGEIDLPSSPLPSYPLK